MSRRVASTRASWAHRSSLGYLSPSLPPSVGLASAPASAKHAGGGADVSTTFQTSLRHVATRRGHSHGDSHGRAGSAHSRPRVSHGSPAFGNTLGHRFGQEGVVETMRHRPSSPQIGLIVAHTGHCGLNAHGAPCPGHSSPGGLHGSPSRGREDSEHAEPPPSGLEPAVVSVVLHAAANARPRRTDADIETWVLRMRLA
jgi:hypothetical protein